MTHNRRLGTYLKRSVAGEVYQAFVPPELPPEPPLNLAPLAKLLAKASRAVGRLDGVADVLPDRDLFLYYYVRKEAVLSSQIEGTQSSLSDLLLYESDEAPSVPVDDVAEVSRYVAAVEHGLRRIRDGFPLSLRLIREMHEILLSTGRGSHQLPGEFRTSQNWIGGSRPGNARFVPPPPERLTECLDRFEKYLHRDERQYSSLIDAGLIHVQFETIHPFLDGNGRIGRLLITFFLILTGDLKQPWLYLSLFFRNNREEYYQRIILVCHRIEQGFAKRGFRHRVGFFPLDTVVRDGRMQIFGQQEVDRAVDLREQSAMNFVVIEKLALGLEIADLDRCSGDRGFRIGMKQQHGCPFQIRPVGEAELIDQRGVIVLQYV